MHQVGPPPAKAVRGDKACLRPVNFSFFPPIAVALSLDLFDSIQGSKPGTSLHLALLNMESKDTKKIAVKGLSRASSEDEVARKTYTIKDHWKCLAACTLVSMCPFQYGRFHYPEIPSIWATADCTDAGAQDLTLV